MKVVGLDLSTSSGLCYFEGTDLIDFNNVVRKVVGNDKSPSYPINYIEMADEIALKVLTYVFTKSPDYVVIEETNRGKERFRQKQLEFIHYAVNKYISNMDNPPRVRYIDTSAWRKILNLSLDSDQRKDNKRRKKERDEKREEISRGIYDKLSSKIESEVQGLKKREVNKIIKKWDREINQLVGKEMKKFRSSIPVNDTKTLSINYVNQNYDLGFKRKDNDIADAICVAEAFIKNNYSSQLIR